MTGDDVTLREYIERIIAEREKQHLERIAVLESLIAAKQMALALAVEKQEAAYDARFVLLNEFRASLNDAVNRSVAREYVDVRFDDIARRLGIVENDNANRSGQAAGYAAGVGLVMLILSIVGSYILLGGRLID